MSASTTHTHEQPLPIGSGTESTFARAKALISLLRSAAAAAPLRSTVWMIIAILQGLMPPFQLWASGRLVAAIETELNGGSAQPWRWAAAMAIAFASVGVAQPLRNWAQVEIQERGLVAVEEAVLRQVASIDLAQFEQQSFYDVVRRMATELTNSMKKSIDSFHTIISNGLPLIGTTLILLWVDYRLAVALLLPMIPAMWLAMRHGSAVWTMLQEQTRDRRIADYIAQRFSDRQSAREIRLYGLSSWLIERWKVHFLATRRELRGTSTKANLKLRVQTSAGDLFTYAALIWLITGGGSGISTADIVIFMGAFMTIYGYGFQLEMALVELGRQSGMGLDLNRFLALPTPFVQTSVSGTPLTAVEIDARGLSFGYPGASRHVLCDIDLQIPAGQRIAIVGENGAGKTTLIKLLLGLYQPDTGEVRIGDHALENIDLAERQATMTAVFQSFNRYPETLRANITMPLEDDTQRLTNAVERASLNDIVEGAPLGLDTVLSPELGGIDLSGGQWQRVAIARATYRNASVLALDEPTAALDPMTEVDIFKRFLSMSEGRTTILVSHRLGMAQLADRIVVLDQGSIAEDGTHEELIARNGIYADLWRMQSRWYL